eukprot:Pompholyxophrys_punicea_v1_NODE_289_length_2364_cov_36.367259.p2 type:complete len:143 gc:universal NODE_289_length_2364_cov_36.367259:1970-1542(-)
MVECKGCGQHLKDENGYRRHLRHCSYAPKIVDKPDLSNLPASVSNNSFATSSQSSPHPPTSQLLHFAPSNQPSLHVPALVQPSVESVASHLDDHHDLEILHSNVKKLLNKFSLTSPVRVGLVKSLSEGLSIQKVVDLFAFFD